MPRTIWKFPISIGGVTTIQIPSQNEDLPHRPLAVLVGLDPATGGPAMWVQLDPHEERVDRRFIIRGTGHSIPDDEVHVGSLIMDGFVWHVYEITESLVG